jgi:hypothetical protein
MATALPFCVATLRGGKASPTALRLLVQLGVSLGHLVTVRALRSIAMRVSSPVHVIEVRHHPKVLRVDASRVVASMVDFKSGRNRPSRSLDDEAVCQVVLAVDGDASVSSASASPQPASAVGFWHDLGPKARTECGITPVHAARFFPALTARCHRLTRSLLVAHAHEMHDAVA